MVDDQRKRFRDLLRELESEHDRMLLTLRMELDSLKGIDGDKTNGYGSMESYALPSFESTTDNSKKERSSEILIGSKDLVAGVRRTSSTSTCQAFRKLTEQGMDWKLHVHDVRHAEWIHGTCQLLEIVGCCSHCLRRVLTWWYNLREPERTSRLARWLHGTHFSFILVVVILANAFYLTAVANEEMREALTGESTHHETFQHRLIFEVAFTAFYIVELFLRLVVHRGYFFVGKNRNWHLFDLALVIISTIDVSIHHVAEGYVRCANVGFLKSLNIMKAIRVLRLMRLTRCVQELRLMMECALNSLYHLFWCIVMLFLLCHMFALILVHAMTSYVLENPASDTIGLVRQHFDTVLNTGISLYMTTTSGWDWKEVYNILGEAGVIYKVLFLLHISFFAVVVWNIVSSTFVEKAIRLGLPGAEANAMMKHHENFAHARELTDMLAEFVDQSHDGCISFENFQKALDDERVQLWFECRHVEIMDAKLFFHMLSSRDETKKKVPLGTFVAACLKLRGAASSLDLQTMHFEMRKSSNDNNKRLRRIERSLQKVAAQEVRELAAQELPESVAQEFQETLLSL